MKDDGGELRLDLGSFNGPEVWIVTGSPGAVPTVHVAAVADSGGTLQIQPGVKQYLFPGEALLAPVDGKRTSEILRSIRESIPPGEEGSIEAVSWPSCWPVNARSW